MASSKIKEKDEIDKRKTREENQASTDEKFYVMMRTMERLMDTLDLDIRPKNIDQQEPQIRNPNFRIPVPPQINQRD